MPRKKTPSTWKPRGLELLVEGADSISEDVLKEAAAEIGLPESCYSDFFQKIRGTAAVLNAELHSKKRPKSADKRSALAAIAAAASELLATIDAIDPNSKRALLIEVSRAPWDKVSEPDPKSLALAGPRRLTKARTGVANIARWALEAVEAIPPDVGGRPSAEEVKQAMAELLEAWRSAIQAADRRTMHPQRPTQKRLVRVFEKVFGPLFATYGLHLVLNDAARSAMRKPSPETGE